MSSQLSCHPTYCDILLGLQQTHSTNYSNPISVTSRSLGILLTWTQRSCLRTQCHACEQPFFIFHCLSQPHLRIDLLFELNPKNYCTPWLWAHSWAVTLLTLISCSASNKRALLTIPAQYRSLVVDHERCSSGDHDLAYVHTGTPVLWTMFVAYRSFLIVTRTSNWSAIQIEALQATEPLHSAPADDSCPKILYYSDEPHLTLATCIFNALSLSPALGHHSFFNTQSNPTFTWVTTYYKP